MNRKYRRFPTFSNAAMIAVIMMVAAAYMFGQGSRQLTQDKAAASAKRTALVIGNANYKAARSLANPVNDATDIAAALGELGFEVIVGTDLNLKQMNDRVREFGDKLRANGGVGLFYYAGHGIQAAGRNYLIPVDADIPREDELEYNAMNLDLVLRKLDTANNGMNIVILDACRNNPFARSWTRSADSGGLAQISAPTGTFIAYATSPDRTASDGEGRNGLYTAQMLKVIRQPNLKIEETFKEVRKAVDAASGGKQIPWDSSSLRGEFYFNRAAGQKAESTAIVSKPEGIIQPERRNESVGERLPAVDDVLNDFARAIGSEAAKKITTLVLTGIMDNELNGQKITTDIEVYFKAPDKSLRLIKFPTGEILGEVFNGGRGWKASTGKPIESLPQAEIEANRRSNAIGYGNVAAIRSLYPSITVNGKQKLGDKEVYALTLKTRDGKTEHLYFNTTTKLLERWQFEESNAAQPGIVYNVDSDFDDYQNVNGYRVPMTVRQRSSGISITIKFNIFQTKFNVPLEDSLFSGN